MASFVGCSTNVDNITPAETIKCLGLGTPVLRYDGRAVAVEDIKVGDFLIGPDGPRAVVSTTRGRGELFSVIPNKGDAWICNAAHILSLKRSGPSRWKDQPRTIDIPLDKYLQKAPTWRTSYKLFRSGAIDFTPRQKVSIDPYFIGIWLGDGRHSVERNIEITTMDREVLDACREIAGAYGLSIKENRKNRNSRAATYSIVSSGGGRFCHNPLLSGLREIFTSSKACYGIPDSYLFSSREERAALLAGLIDTDGGYARTRYGQGYYHFTQASERLAKDLAFLARSLGLYVNESVVPINNRTYYRLHISGDASSLPIRVARKRQVHSATTAPGRAPGRTGFRIKPLGVGEYAGFTLDGPDGRFLLGDFTVTHNSGFDKVNAHYHDYDAVTLKNVSGVTNSTGDVLALASTGTLPAANLGDTQASLKQFVVAQGSITSLSTGEYARSGRVNIRVTGTVTAGNYLRKAALTRAAEDAGVAQADAASPPSGAFAVAMSCNNSTSTAIILAELLGLTVGPASAPTFVLSPESAVFPTCSFPLLTRNFGTNWTDYTLDYTTATSTMDRAMWRSLIPGGVNVNSATLDLYWRRSTANTTSTGTVGWKIQTITRAPGEVWDTAGSTDLVTGISSSTVEAVIHSSVALTVTGWAANEVIFFKIQRDDGAVNTLSSSARLMGATIRLE